MQKQINSYVEKHLSSFLCGYRKGYSTQIVLGVMIEKWMEKMIDNHGYSGVVLMDLSKIFDALNHDLLLAKL